MGLQIAPVDLSGVYHVVRERGGSIASGVGAGTRFLLPDGAVVAASAATAGRCIFPLKASRYPAPPGKSLKLNLDVNVQTNDVAPGVTFAFGLYPVTAAGGTSGSDTITVGSVIAASVATLATPAADQPYLPAESGDFTFPADGAYVIGVNTSAAIASAGDTTFRATLLRRFA